MKRDLTALKAIISADYKRHVKRFGSLSPEKKIIFIGDSIVAYFPLKSYQLSNDIYNMGIPGDTTKGVIERLDQVTRLNPEKIIIHIGLNDEILLNFSVNQTIENIQQIVRILKKSLVKTNIYIVSLTPVNQSEFPHSTYVIDRHPEFAIKVNEAIKHIENTTFINLYDVLTDQHHELQRILTTDGIHLNKNGYDIYANMIANLLK